MHAPTASKCVLSETAKRVTSKGGTMHHPHFLAESNLPNVSGIQGPENVWVLMLFICTMQVELLCTMHC